MAQSFAEREPIDYDLCIQSLKVYRGADLANRITIFLEDLLGETEICTKVRYGGHEVVQHDEDRDLYLRLEFGGQRRVSASNRSIAQGFCASLFKPEAAHAVSNLSKFGIMGFSAADNSFGMCWNVVAVDSMLRQGQQLLDEKLEKPKRNRWPIWLNVACVAGTTTLQHCFYFPPNLWGADYMTTTQNIMSLGQNVYHGSSYSHKTALWCMDSLQQWAISKGPAGDGATATKKLSASVGLLFEQSEHLLESIDTMLDRDMISMSDQLRLCKELYSLFEVSGEIWSSSETVMQIYREDSRAKTAAAVTNSASAISAGLYVMKASQVASSHRQAAEYYLQNVRVESFWKQTKRGLHFTSDPTPQQIATDMANERIAAAKKVENWVFGTILVILFQICQIIWSYICARRSAAKAETLRKVHAHTMNLVFITLQARTSLMLVATTGGNVSFDGEARTAWEAFLRERHGQALPEEHLQQDFVRRELRQYSADLKDFGQKLRAQAASVL